MVINLPTSQNSLLTDSFYGLAAFNRSTPELNLDKAGRKWRPFWLHFLPLPLLFEVRLRHLHHFLQCLQLDLVKRLRLALDKG